MYPTLAAYTDAVAAELTPDNFVELDADVYPSDELYVVDLPAHAVLLAALYARDVPPRKAAGCMIASDVDSSYVRSRFASYDELVDALVHDEDQYTR